MEFAANKLCLLYFDLKSHLSTEYYFQSAILLY
jgi:hypothetical protein